MTQHYETFKILKNFSFEHLPEGPLKDTSKMCHNLAHEMVDRLPDEYELRVGLRKLLEAKDCFVRQALDLITE